VQVRLYLSNGDSHHSLGICESQNSYYFCREEVTGSAHVRCKTVELGSLNVDLDLPVSVSMHYDAH